MKDCLRPEQTLAYAGRDFAAAPSVGSSALHAQQQLDLVEQALLG
jgi:2-oxoglutarate dehydrogenase E1 component